MAVRLSVLLPLVRLPTRHIPRASGWLSQSIQSSPSAQSAQDDAFEVILSRAGLARRSCCRHRHNRYPLQLHSLLPYCQPEPQCLLVVHRLVPSLLLALLRVLRVVAHLLWITLSTNENMRSILYERGFHRIFLKSGFLLSFKSDQKFQAKLCRQCSVASQWGS